MCVFGCGCLSPKNQIGHIDINIKIKYFLEILFPFYYACSFSALSIFPVAQVSVLMKLYIAFLFRADCPVCRTRMDENMFSPLTLNITDLLTVSLIFMDQGCNIKLKKKEMLEHEKEECIYRELMCPGCKEKIQACKLPDHFQICPRLIRRDDWQHEEETQTMHRACSGTTVFRPRVLKLTNSKNWFLLCADVSEDKLVFYMKHYSGEMSKKRFNFDLKISDIGKTLSRSMSGVCTPIDMEIKDARRKGFTLDISVEAMENMYY